MPTVRDELHAALCAAPGALEAFEALPPSHRQRWLDAIGEAKKSETRARRIEQCVREVQARGPSAGVRAGGSRANAKRSAGSTADMSSDTARGAPAAGYSGTPLPVKLGIKPGRRVAVLGAPATPSVVPEGMQAADALGGGTFDVIVVFVRSRADLVRGFGDAKRALDPAGGLWIAWPKRASGVPTDLTEDVIREVALAAGLVDNKVCAIDATWSGLRLVYRVKDRPAR